MHHFGASQKKLDLTAQVKEIKAEKITEFSLVDYKVR